MRSVAFFRSFFSSFHAARVRLQANGKQATTAAMCVVPSIILMHCTELYCYCCCPASTRSYWIELSLCFVDNSMHFIFAFRFFRFSRSFFHSIRHFACVCVLIVMVCYTDFSSFFLSRCTLNTLVGETYIRSAGFGNAQPFETCLPSSKHYSFDSLLSPSEPINELNWS